MIYFYKDHEQYFIYNLVNLGFTKQTTDAMVAGIALSIVRAHTALKPGYIFLSETEVEEQISINRSPKSYDANPNQMSILEWCNSTSTIWITNP